MLYTPNISGQAKTFWRAMLAHLQGISPSARGTSANFLKSCFWQNSFTFFALSVLLFALVERLCFSWIQDFFITYLRWKLVISYSYFSMGKIIVFAFLHTLKIIHSWDTVVIKLSVSQPDSDICHNKHQPTPPQRFSYDITTYCCAIATTFTQKIINNRKYWGSWNSATIHSYIRKEPSGYDNGTFKQKTRSYRSKLGGDIFWTAISLSKTEFLMERHKFLPPCMSENIAGCVRHNSSQLVGVLFLSFCILAQIIYDQNS